jgi:hypothetical protein
MPVVNPNTLFPILQIDGDADWLELLTLTNNFLTPVAMEKMKAFFGTAARSVIVERGYIDKDYRDTYAGFYAKKFAQYPSRTARLHFFNKRLDENSLFSLEAEKDAYIGFMVIRPTRVSCIGRSIINPRKVPGIKGTMCIGKFKVHIAGAQLEVDGFPYISQDTDVTVCAHAAAWMVFRYFSERYPNYAEAYPYQISQMILDRSHGRLVPSKGLTIYQLSEMFSHFGFYPEIYIRDPKNPDPDLFDRLLYYYIESGIPVVAGLGSKQHAITLLGHVSDYTLCPTGTGVCHSGAFVTGWVANDDNHMPYQIVPMPKTVFTGHVSTHITDQIDVFVVPLYEKIYLSAEYIEKLAGSLLLNKQYGLAALSPSLPMTDLVVRIFLTTSRAYRCFWRKNPIPNELDQLYRQLPMPKFIWVCELSTRSLYPQQKILGEIVWDATANHNDPFPFLIIHYPQALIVNNRDSMSDGPDRFFINQALPNSDAYSMYRNNLVECP